MYWICGFIFWVHVDSHIFLSLALSLVCFSEGSNLTPAHHYSDFRFKTYAPIAFRYFRELFGIRPDDYLVSIYTKDTLPYKNCSCCDLRHFPQINFVEWVEFSLLASATTFWDWEYFAHGKKVSPNILQWFSVSTLWFSRLSYVHLMEQMHSYFNQYSCLHRLRISSYWLYACNSIPKLIFMLLFYFYICN